jgi:GNAT superfamily N-acetyltransferase
VNHREILALFDQQERIGVEFPGLRKEVLPHVVRFVSGPGDYSFVLYSRLDEETVEAAIDEQIAYFAALGQPFEWKVYDYDTPADLRQRLAARGFAVGEAEAVMVLELDRIPPALLAPVTADVRQITTRAGLEDVIRVRTAVEDGDYRWLRARLSDHLDIPDYLSVYVAYVDDTPVCAAWIYFQPGSQFGGLWGGSTVPAYRGRGLYTAVVAVRAQEAQRRGCRFLTIDASPMSRPIVARHGFQLLTMTSPCEWPTEGPANL